MINKNLNKLESFVKYCQEHPEQRFWQALSNWSGLRKIYYEKYVSNVDDVVLKDTFYLN